MVIRILFTKQRFYSEQTLLEQPLKQIWRRSRKQVEKPHGIAEIVGDRRANQSEEKKGAEWSAIFRPSKLRKHVNRIIFELASSH